MASGTLLRRRTTLVAVFETHRALVEVFDRALASGLVGVLDVGHAALITRDEQGEFVTINNNVSAREGVFSGAMLGLTIAGLSMFLLGALDGPDVAATLTLIASLLIGGVLGGAIGRAVAAMAGLGFAPALFSEIERTLSPGQVALLIRVRPASVPLVRRELGAQADVFLAEERAASRARR